MCDELKDEKEIEIIKKYGYDAKRYTVVLIGKDFFMHLLHFLINIYVVQI